MKGIFAKAFFGTLVLGSLFGVANVSAYEYMILRRYLGRGIKRAGKRSLLI